MKTKIRDLNILKSFKGEISLRTRVKKSKKIYSRKIKHTQLAQW